MGRASKHKRALAAVGLVAVAVAATAGAPRAAAAQPRAKHVVLLSIDGMHQSDLAWFVARHPGSTLARLAAGGREFANARTPFPSDSFPGMVGQVTGGNPASTGIYYDDSWNRALLPAGTTDCSHATPGVEVTYFEAADLNQQRLDAGQGLAGLPGSILGLTGKPVTVINPAALPVDPATCRSVYPHSYLKVNTVFEVARAAGMRTAWSDKHPAYDILNGPSGTGVQDLFTPEINSGAPLPSSSIDWTKDNVLTQQYDAYKVQAVLNEIDGFDHSRRQHVGVPAIFGMNFQSVSTAQKLPTSQNLPGGYLADGVTPGPLLQRALDFVDDQVGRMVSELRAQGLGHDTAIIISAKHGQSPRDPAALTRIDDGPIIAGLDAAWLAQHPTAVQPLVAFSIDDDGMLMWLNDRSATAATFARNFLLANSGTGNDIHGNPKPYTRSGLRTVHAGEAAADFMGVRPGDARVPDLIGIAQYGTVYTGGHGKIAEHGGDNPQDRHVLLLVGGDPVSHAAVSWSAVETTQIAPTILSLLGLDPGDLQAVKLEHTAVLDLS